MHTDMHANGRRSPVSNQDVNAFATCR